MSHTIGVSRVVVRRPSGVAGGAELRWALSYDSSLLFSGSVRRRILIENRPKPPEIA